MVFRKAEQKDLMDIVGMLANDPLGALREDLQHPEKYQRAFEVISKDDNQELIVVENDGGEVVGTFHLTFIQYLTHQGRQGSGRKKCFNGLFNMPRQKAHTCYS